MTENREIIPPGSRRRWSEEEIALLRDLYPDMTVDEVGARLGRSAWAVWNKAHRLGVGRSADFNAALRLRPVGTESAFMALPEPDAAPDAERPGAGRQTIEEVPGGRIIRHRMGE
ncbi:MAG: GcrA family cell cycle regulator [Candidatus Accumulibacter sp.]|jgi:hypothetical protein|nr:GcrA family cell cycle regulator [Accumulibacter sp.]